MVAQIHAKWENDYNAYNNSKSTLDNLNYSLKDYLYILVLHIDG